MHRAVVAPEPIGKSHEIDIRAAVAAPPLAADAQAIVLVDHLADCHADAIGKNACCRQGRTAIMSLTNPVSTIVIHRELV
jgi:hypothetical protein